MGGLGNCGTWNTCLCDLPCNDSRTPRYLWVDWFEGHSSTRAVRHVPAGMGFIMEVLPGGDILLKHAVVVPSDERWLHEPAMKEKLARADEWMRNNPVHETNLE